MRCRTDLVLSNTCAESPEWIVTVGGSTLTATMVTAAATAAFVAVETWTVNS